MSPPLFRPTNAGLGIMICTTTLPRGLINGFSLNYRVFLNTSLPPFKIFYILAKVIIEVNGKTNWKNELLWADLENCIDKN